MSKEIYEIGISEYKVAEDPVILVSSGVGSCMIIALYDRTKKVGGMAHAMLPEKRESSTAKDNPVRFVDGAIEVLLKEMEGLGCKKENIVAKITGGSDMFSTLGVYSKEIGQRNTEKAKQVLADLEIELVADSTGGRSGRHVEFNLANGILSIILKI